MKQCLNARRDAIKLQTYFDNFVLNKNSGNYLLYKAISTNMYLCVVKLFKLYSNIRFLQVFCFNYC